MLILPIILFVENAKAYILCLFDMSFTFDALLLTTI